MKDKTNPNSNLNLEKDMKVSCGGRSTHPMPFLLRTAYCIWQVSCLELSPLCLSPASCTLFLWSAWDFKAPKDGKSTITESLVGDGEMECSTWSEAHQRSTALLRLPFMTPNAIGVHLPPPAEWKVVLSQNFTPQPLLLEEEWESFLECHDPWGCASAGLSLWARKNQVQFNHS